MYDYIPTMSDRDLGDLIAYLKQILPVDTNYPERRLGSIIPIAPAVGLFTPAAALIDQDAARPADPATGATVEYGKYLSVICAGCHGKSVAGKLEKRSNQDLRGLCQ
jgi:mono/diheme cytochrome c family protein